MILTGALNSKCGYDPGPEITVIGNGMNSRWQGVIRSRKQIPCKRVMPDGMIDKFKMSECNKFEIG
jgi:hypothetical protein